MNNRQPTYLSRTDHQFTVKIVNVPVPEPVPEQYGVSDTFTILKERRL